MCYKTHGYYRTWLVLIKYQSPAHFIVSVNSANFKISKQLNILTNLVTKQNTQNSI